MSTDAARRRRGTVLEGRYRMDGVLARGGMSTVHRGMDLRLRRPVAIKVMAPALARDPAFVRRFEREARAAARLAHPGIVAVHDQGRDTDGTVFLVLELVEGGTLRDVLRREGRLRPAAALTVVEQMVTALRVAHARGLVHRDVKPENVLVAQDGAVKVADFGLVGAVWPGAADDDPDGELGDGDLGNGTSGDGMLLGTAAYLAPEQIADGRSDARTDLYAAGIVLYELLTGVPPHTGETALDVAHRHVHADVPAPSRHADGVPPALDRLVLAATGRDPDRRPASAGAFLTALRAARAEAGLAVSPVAPAGPRTRRGTPASPPVPPPRRPPTGTRRLDLDDLPRDGPARRSARGADLDDLDRDDLDDEPDDLDALDQGPDEDRGPAVRRARGVDDVDDRIERLARRWARARSRRWFAAWLIAVTAVTAAAGSVGWSLGLPG